MTLVVDASLVFAALLDDGPDGEWAESQIAEGDLVAPELLLAAAANALRNAERAGRISSDVASLAYDDLLRLPATLFPYEPLADRVWQLRHAVTAYDGWYVALAEALDAGLATLDLRLTRAPGPTCSFITPPA